MTILWIALLTLLATLIFDITWYKVSKAIELEKSWRELNEKLEREGKERWDEKKSKQ